MRNTGRTRLACFVLATLCAPVAVAQDIGIQESPPKPAIKLPGIQLKPKNPLQIVPSPNVSVESYLPSARELNEVQIDDRLSECIVLLGDPAYAVREAATAQLLTGDFVRRQIYAALLRLELTGEQRYRLLTAVQDNLLLTPRGAVGISVNLRFRGEDKIVVEQLLPDLPARDVLHIGDRITHLHGRPLPNWRAFVKEVQTREPGAKITVTVERIISGRRASRRQIGFQEPTYTTMDIEIELGSAEMLRDPISGKVQRTGDVFKRLKAEATEVGGTFAPKPKQIKLEQ
jgi:hypothetical protein